MHQQTTQTKRFEKLLNWCQGQVREIMIARNGRPAAKLVPIDSVGPEKRIGIAKGLFTVPDNIDAHNDEVARLFAMEPDLEPVA